METSAGSSQEPSPRLLEFGSRYFPHYVEQVASSFHEELCRDLEAMSDSHEGEKRAYAAPRGTAKTTWVSLIYVIYCVVHRKKNFIVLITNTSSLAESLIRDIKNELEDNERLIADFPDACGRGRLWRQDELETNNGVRVLGLGAGKRIRGRKNRQHRPDLIILDDLENDEQVRSPEQRDKLHDWLNRAVLKAKGIAKKADFIAIGTLLHFDSVLARLLDPRRSPGWQGRKYRSVIRWSDRPDLWQEWETRYTNWHKPDSQRLREAEEFFLGNQNEMLRGTAVLWPDVESYYTLMRLRIDEGPRSFDSEKQNEPIDPSECQFPESWFVFFDLVEINGEVWLAPDRGDRIRLSDCDIYGAVDPSMGKRDKHRDPSAIVLIAAHPSRGIDSENDYRTFWCIEADIRRRHPHIITRDILDYHRMRCTLRFGVEAVQFQELFAEQVQEAALNAPDICDLRVIQLKPISDKALRIQKLSPYIVSGRLRFSRKLTELYRQLRYWPHADHDDGPDSLELCMEVVGALGTQFLDLSWQAAEPPDRHPYAEQISYGLRFDIDQNHEEDDTCRTCENLQRCGDGRYRCAVTQWLVTQELLGCDYYIPNPTRP